MIVAGGLGLEVEMTDPEIEISMLRSDHEEANTKVVLHCVHASSQHIVVSARDTDITIILLAHFDSMHCEKLWLKAGTSKQPKYIPIHEIRNTLSFEQPVLDALLAFHAIAGCDTVSYLMGHSKKTSWDVFLEHNKLLQKIGEDSTVSEDGIRMAEAFICRIYKVPYDNCDKGRVHLFSKCKPPESLPPTTDAIWRNDIYDLTRVDYFAKDCSKGEGKYYCEAYVSAVHDFKNDLAYVTEGGYGCKVVPLSNVTGDADITDFGGLVQMSGPLSILERQNIWTFKLKETYRNIPVNIYLGHYTYFDKFDGKDATSIVELSFAEHGSNICQMCETYKGTKGYIMGSCPELNWLINHSDVLRNSRLMQRKLKTFDFSIFTYLGHSINPGYKP
ncbi:hypothetical protein GQR58_012109 [Nymphon striatum]|nr:hypothetical protein GQR58_012109 [Nymphon striatum]